MNPLTKKALELKMEVDNLRSQRDRLLESLKQCHDFPCVQERLFRKGSVPKPCPHCAAIEETEK